MATKGSFLGKLAKLLDGQQKKKPKPKSAAKPRYKVRVERETIPEKPPRPIRYRQSAKDPAPIIDDPTRREVDVDYRREGDEKHIFRVNQIQPKGYPKKIAEYIPVSGVSYRQEDVIAFIAGRNRRLSLRREVIIEGEPLALAVDGAWEDWDGNAHAATLGYIPGPVNAAIGDNPVDVTLEAMYQARPDYSAGLRIDLWSKRGVERVNFDWEKWEIDKAS